MNKDQTLIEDQVTQPWMPDFLTTPWWWIWIVTLPQILLFTLAQHHYWIISEEINSSSRWDWWTLFILEGITAISGIVAFILNRKFKNRISWWQGLIQIALGSLLVTWLMNNDQGLFPLSLGFQSEWMIQSSDFFGLHIGLWMPMIIGGLWRIAGIPSPFTLRKDTGYSVLGIIAAPVSWFGVGFLSLIFSPLNNYGFDRISGSLFVLIFVTTTFVLMVSLLRLILLWGQKWGLREKGDHRLVTLLFTLVFPLGGLILNHYIPFPTSFQEPIIYGLAIFNGFIVALPYPEGSWGRLVLFTLKAITFSFTLYFFIVFLPYLPLFIPAMILFGLGFLILAPTILIGLHSIELHRGWKILGTSFHPGLRTLILIIGFALLPTLWISIASRDRLAIHSALDFVYYPHDDGDQIFDSNLWNLKNALDNLNQIKSHSNKPFLTNLYSKIVMDQMVLPDDKLNKLYHLFLGQERPKIEPSMNGIFSSSPRSESRWEVEQQNTAPPRTVDLLQALWSQVPPSAEGVKSQELHLTLKNRGEGNAEFWTELELPETVLIEQFQLKIGEQWVEGRLFEKKAAEWVYQKIIHTRRDPAILRYLTPTQLDLRVYPFALNEVREVKIKFLFPAGEPVDFQSFPERLVFKTSKNKNLQVKANDQYYSLFSKELLSTLPHLNRKPYLHFVVDRSASGAIDLSSIDWKPLVKILTPSTRFAILDANFNRIHRSTTMMSDWSVEKIIHQSPLPIKGGRDDDSILKSIEWFYQKQISDSSGKNQLFDEYPVVIWLSKVPPKISPLLLREWKEKFASEALLYYWNSPLSLLESLFFQTSHTSVIAFKSGKQTTWANDETNRWLPSLLPDWSHFDNGSFKTLSPQLENNLLVNKKYLQGLKLLSLEKRLEEERYNVKRLLPEIVLLSKSIGLLSPSLSFIVVENSMQWKTLEEAEKKKLKGHQSLEFNEPNSSSTPEPSTYVLMILAGLIFYWKKCLDKKNLSTISAYKDRTNS